MNSSILNAEELFFVHTLLYAVHKRLRMLLAVAAIGYANDDHPYRDALAALVRASEDFQKQVAETTYQAHASDNDN